MKVHLALAAVALTAMLLTTTQLAGETSPAARSHHAVDRTLRRVASSPAPPPPPPPPRSTRPARTCRTARSSRCPARARSTSFPGNGPVVGTGPLRTYAVEIENGITVDEQAFAAFVDATLSDPRGWTARGARSVQRVSGAGLGARPADVPADRPDRLRLRDPGRRLVPRRQLRVPQRRPLDPRRRRVPAGPDRLPHVHGQPRGRARVRSGRTSPVASTVARRR